jgi:hypothetical protein
VKPDSPLSEPDLFESEAYRLWKLQEQLRKEKGKATDDDPVDQSKHRKRAAPPEDDPGQSSETAPEEKQTKSWVLKD